MVCLAKVKTRQDIHLPINHGLLRITVWQREPKYTISIMMIIENTKQNVK